MIQIPDEFVIPTSGNDITKFVKSIYPDLDKNLININYLRDGCILVPTNEWVEEINSYVVSIISGSLRNYLSADSISPISNTTDDQNIMYPPEFFEQTKNIGSSKS